MEARAEPSQCLLPPLFKPTSESILTDARAAISKIECVWDDIVTNVALDRASVENTILPVAHGENESRITYDVIYLDATTHP